jgi:ABC-type oligopeptide transport system ATPase subunit
MYQGGSMTAPALELRQVTKSFPLRGTGLFSRSTGEHIAVNKVDLVLPRNKVVALVGESGSGKTTTGLLALRLLSSTSGQILLDGQDITDLDYKALKPYRRQMQVVFQDSYASLDPMMTLGEIIAEPLWIHELFTPAERRDQARRWLEKVGLDARYATRYPHELSGGQRQRISVARALILGASVLVADEPTSALDVSVKAQIVNLLQDLQADMGLSILFISHDLSVVRSLADEVVVMLRGRVVERAPTDRIFAEARHPYTQSLLDAVPVIDPKARRRRTFLSADEISARTPKLRASDLDTQPLLDTADPQLVALAGSHFVEAIVTG